MIATQTNKNGQALFGSDDLALMVSLNLRNMNSSAFDPASYSAFKDWLRPFRSPRSFTYQCSATEATSPALRHRATSSPRPATTQAPPTPRRERHDACQQADAE
jgi:hypothetical protein